MKIIMFDVATGKDALYEMDKDGNFVKVIAKEEGDENE